MDSDKLSCGLCHLDQPNIATQLYRLEKCGHVFCEACLFFNSLYGRHRVCPECGEIFRRPRVLTKEGRTSKALFFFDRTEATSPELRKSTPGPSGLGNPTTSPCSSPFVRPRNPKLAKCNHCRSDPTSDVDVLLFRLLECGHIFCEGCLNMTESKNCCPSRTCRRRIRRFQHVLPTVGPGREGPYQFIEWYTAQARLESQIGRKSSDDAPFSEFEPVIPEHRGSEGSEDPKNRPPTHSEFQRMISPRDTNVPEFVPMPKTITLPLYGNPSTSDGEDSPHN